MEGGGGCFVGAILGDGGEAGVSEVESYMPSFRKR